MQQWPDNNGGFQPLQSGGQMPYPPPPMQTPQPAPFPNAAPPPSMFPAAPPPSMPGQYQPLLPPQYSRLQPPPPPKKKSRRGWKIAGAGFVLLVLLVVIANATSQASPPAPSQQQSTAQTGSSNAQASPTHAFAHFEDGTYVIGKDIQPGTYRTREASDNCYYARLQGFDNTLDDIIANENTDGPAVVTISAKDKGFQTTGCGTWTKDLSAITRDKTSFSDGTYIVKTDIEPGTYKNTGTNNCYFARLKGFGGTLSEIIANDNTDISTIVTISAQDKGFLSAGCGTWTKM